MNNFQHNNEVSGEVIDARLNEIKESHDGQVELVSQIGSARELVSAGDNVEAIAARRVANTKELKRGVPVVSNLSSKMTEEGRSPREIGLETHATIDFEALT